MLSVIVRCLILSSNLYFHIGFGLVVGAVSAAIMFQWVRSKVRKWSAAAKKKTDGDVMRYFL